MYHKLEDKPTIFFDVDETLVLWDTPPDTINGEEYLVVNYLGGKQPADNIKVVPHTPHINRLKESHNEGYKIVVWSQGGSNWAEAVIKKLNLEHYVDVIISKPEEYYDDLMSWQFMGPNTYLPHGRE